MQEQVQRAAQWGDAPARVYRVGDFEIGLIKKRVLFAEAPEQVPKGWQMASSNQEALAYKMVAGFRQELIDAPCAVWAGDETGIESSGERSIDNKGNRVPLKLGQKWSDLAPEDRAHEGAGSGPVAVDAYYGDGGGLDVYAGYGARDEAWVAVSRKVTPEVPKGVVLRGLSINKISGISADLDTAQEAINAARKKLQALEIKS